MATESQTPSERQPLLPPSQDGQNDALLDYLSSTNSPRDERPFTIRDTIWSDIYQMGLIASRAYMNAPLADLQKPYRRQYPQDYVNGFYQWIAACYLSSRNRSFVAVAEDEPQKAVAYMQCVRLGNDDGAKRVMREKRSLWLGVREWLWKAYLKVLKVVKPDRSESADGVAVFAKSNEGNNKPFIDRGLYDRWYVQSMVVSDEWRQRGLGKALMREVLKRAESEGKPVSLESSGVGSYLYNSLGFKMLQKFKENFGDKEREARGGVMLWSPPVLKKSGNMDDPLIQYLNSANCPRDERPFIVREATFKDSYEMGLVASRAYMNSKLTDVLQAFRWQYPQDYVNGFYQRIALRSLSSRNRGFVAVAVDEPNKPVAYMQCTCMGNDEGAKRVMKEKGSWWLSMKEWAFGTYLKVYKVVRPDRCESAEGIAAFIKHCESNDIYFKDKSLVERWYVQSMVVSDEWRQRGVGKALMREVLKRAESEGKTVSLESSAMGEYLYGSLGFKVLGRFSDNFGDDEMENRGGVMLWSPPKSLLQSEQVVDEIAASGTVAGA